MIVDAGSENTIHWTILNRYYMAEVHFRLVELKQWSPWELEGVPAVVYAWSPDQVSLLCINGRSVLTEVFLVSHTKTTSKTLVEFLRSAVRKSYWPSERPRPVHQVSLHLQTRKTIWKRSFRTMDLNLLTRTSLWSMQMERLHTMFHDRSLVCVASLSAFTCLIYQIASDTPGIHRAVDALSTIMWPSMIRSSKNQNVKDKARQLMEVLGVEDEPDDQRDLLREDDDSLWRDDEDEVSMENDDLRLEMRALERWLDGDDDALAARFPIESQSSHTEREVDGSGFFAVPSEHDSGLTSSAPNVGSDAAYGFEDDFTEFVSATQPSTASLDDDDDPSYHSLDSDEEELGIPSQKDIQETAKTLFGTHTQDRTLSSSGDDREHLDLSNVVSVVQDYKTQIANMTDDDERRETAARVALGLVHGLS